MSVDVMTEIVIERSVAVVSAYATDPSNAPMVSNIASVEWKSSPPARVGTTIEFVARFLGRRLVYTYEFIELVAGERLVCAPTKARSRCRRPTSGQQLAKGRHA